MFSPTTSLDRCLYDPLKAINRPPYEKYAVLCQSAMSEPRKTCVLSLQAHVALSPPSESSNLYT